MALQTIEIPDKKIKVIKEYKSITIPTSTDNIYYSYSGIYNGDFTDWKPITEIQDEPSNYSKYSMVFIANNTGGSITIEYDSYTIEDCYTEDACHNIVMEVDFNPIPISMVKSDESSNEYDNHRESGVGWVNQTNNGIVFGCDRVINGNFFCSGTHGGYNEPRPYNGEHQDDNENNGENWATNQDNFNGGDGASDPNTTQKVTSTIRIKKACTVDGAMLEVHMYNGIYEGFTVKYRYALIDQNDDLYISNFKQKYINTKDEYILDMRVREVNSMLSDTDVTYGSIEVKVVPDANFAESSFVSEWTEPIYINPYIVGIDPILTLVGDATIFTENGEEYIDEGATYKDDGFPDAPEVLFYATNIINHISSSTYYYSTCGSEITREVYDGHIHNQGDELIINQNGLDEVYWTEVEYEVKIRDNIEFTYTDYQIIQIDSNNNIIITYPINTTVVEFIEYLDETRIYTVKFFNSGTELLMTEDIVVEASPIDLPYNYSANITAKNTLTNEIDTRHTVVYDIEEYSIIFNNWTDNITINPKNNLDIPLNHEHYTTSKYIEIKDAFNNILFTETVGGSDNFNVNDIEVFIRDNTLNVYILYTTLKLTNKNNLDFEVTDTAFLVYEKYIEPTGSYEVVTDNGSELIVKTSRGSVYTTTGDIYDQLVENIGSKFRMSLDLKNGNSSILQVIENGTLLINENATGSHTFIKDNDVVNIYEKASPLFFFSTEGYVIESINDYPIILLNRGNNQIKLLITILNNISGNIITSIEVKITNLLNNNIVTTNGDIAGKYVNISISNNLETGTLMCIECTVMLNNGMNNTTRMVGKVI